MTAVRRPSRARVNEPDHVTDELSHEPITLIDVDPPEEPAEAMEAAARPARGRPRRARLGGVAAFDYLNSALQLAGSYRAIMGVFLANSDTFGINIPTEQVFARLQEAGVPHEVRSAEHLENLLDNLERWGNVGRTQDASLAKTIDDFKRKRSLWRITKEGRVAEEAARAIEASFEDQGALRSNVLAALRAGIDELATLAEKPTFDAADGQACDNLLRGIFSGTKELADSASAFLANLDDFLSSPDITSDAFVLARDVIVGYVGGFLTDLRTGAPVIAAAISEIEDVGAERLIRAAAESNTPPSLDEEIDPLVIEIERISERWAGVSAWFLGTGSSQARSRDLANRAESAINALLRVLARLNDARRRTISRARDFAALARWFEDAPDDATAHRIWHAVFGVAGARHIRYPHPDEQFLPANASWWTTMPVPIEPRLRALGRYDNRGRGGAIEDTRAVQAALRAKVERREAEQKRALDRFLDQGELRFSSLPALTDPEFDLVCDCLMTALATRPESDGTFLASSLDGLYLIHLIPPARGAPLAELGGPRGRLRGIDYAIELVAARTGRVRRKAAS